MINGMCDPVLAAVVAGNSLSGMKEELTVCCVCWWNAVNAVPPTFRY